LVAPLEFTVRRDDYERMGGHMAHLRPLADVLAESASRQIAPRADSPWPLNPLSRQ
jgi:hypothetical protein